MPSLIAYHCSAGCGGGRDASPSATQTLDEGKTSRDGQPYMRAGAFPPGIAALT